MSRSQSHLRLGEPSVVSSLWFAPRQNGFGKIGGETGGPATGGAVYQQLDALRTVARTYGETPGRESKSKRLETLLCIPSIGRIGAAELLGSLQNPNGSYKA